MASVDMKNWWWSLAQHAVRAEHYEEMADLMQTVEKLGAELFVEDRNPLGEAYKNAADSRRAAWKIITSMEQKEKPPIIDADEAVHSHYTELQNICDKILDCLADNHINARTTSESKVFYLQMKADYYHYIAELSTGDAEAYAELNAFRAYEEAKQVAEADLAANHPIRLGLILNYSVFQYEQLQNPGKALRLACTATEEATAMEGIAWPKEVYELSAIICAARLEPACCAYGIYTIVV